jgi:hypothetical protein
MCFALEVNMVYTDRRLFVSFGTSQPGTFLARLALFGILRQVVMADYKVTFFYEALRAGWTETWYYTASNQGITLDAAVALSAKRVLMLARDLDCKLVRIRIVNEANPNDLLAEDYFIPNTGVFRLERSDMPWTGIGFDARNTGVLGAVRHGILRGVPDNITISPWFDSPAFAQWVLYFQDWMVLLLNSLWRLKTNPRPLLSVMPNIAALSTDPADGALLVETLTPHLMVTGDLAVFSKVKAVPTLRGRHRVVRITATQVKMPHYNVGVVNFLGQGGIWKAAPLYQQINGYNLGHKEEHKVGRPFGLLRGRVKRVL